MSLSLDLADFVASLRFEQVPGPVVNSVKDRVMDTLGICTAARGGDAAEAARVLAAEWGGSPEASLVGEATRLPAPAAALVNGTYAHSLDFDDTHLPSVVHPSAPMLPALLAVAEASGTAGREFLVSAAAAYEVNTRLAMAQFDPDLGNSIFFERGLHATSIIGAVAAAAACARLRGLGSEGIAHAIAIAASMGAGLIEANRGGGTVKKFHGGWAAHCAVVAAGMAAHGLTGPDTVLEGRFGFFQAFCGDRWRPEEVTRDLGRAWNTPGIFFKPYPCNHFTHAVADAAFALRTQGVGPADIAEVQIGTAAASLRTIGEPIAEKRSPRSAYHGAFSAPWVFALAMAGGSGLGLSSSDFTESLLQDPVRRRMAELCEVVADSDCDAVFPHQFPAVVTVLLRDGRRLTERVMTNLGGPERPLSRAQLLSKLQSNAGDAAPAIAEACRLLDVLPTVTPLLVATRSQSPTTLEREGATQ